MFIFHSFLLKKEALSFSLARTITFSLIHTSDTLHIILI